MISLFREIGVLSGARTTGGSMSSLFTTALRIVIELRVGVVSTTIRFVAVEGVISRGDSSALGRRVACAGGASLDLDFFGTCGNSSSGEGGALRFVLILAPGGV
jgi:hypothetical protein